MRLKKTITAITLVYASLLLMAQAEAPPEISEEVKVRALKLGYLLNGESMVRHPGLGSIDVSGLLYIDKPVEVPPLKLTPPTYPGSKGFSGR